MKKLIGIVLTLMVAFGAFVLMSADVYNYAGNAVESKASVHYHGQVLIPAASSTDTHYSESFLIWDCNDADGYLVIDGDSTGLSTSTFDINGYIEYSADNAVWTTGTTDPTLDALGLTAVFDTLGYAAGANDIKFHSLKWARLKFDGQSGNESIYVNWDIILTKDAPGEDAGYVSQKVHTE